MLKDSETVYMIIINVSIHVVGVLTIKNACL